MERALGSDKNRGFTLVELIVVILIVAIISGGTTVGFTVINNNNVKSAAERLTLTLGKTRQEAINRVDGSVWMKLYQDTEGTYYSSIIFRDGSVEKVLSIRKIGGSLLKLSVKKNDESIVYINTVASMNPAIITASEVLFHFKKSTGGIQEPFKDIYIEGSETKDIILIQETGRCFIN
ncbi:MAG: hypothetical protein K0S01_2093 [Herbinix sp.]|jgi:prepilin-type N-terminal cleavage/methylation domain-containing protein|nr:hypothetical protein [Herbinix sp.]